MSKASVAVALSASSSKTAVTIHHTHPMPTMVLTAIDFAQSVAGFSAFTAH
jgi:hypothetical protein